MFIVIIIRTNQYRRYKEIYTTGVYEKWERRRKSKLCVYKIQVKCIELCNSRPVLKAVLAIFDLKLELEVGLDNIDTVVECGVKNSI